MHDVHRKADFLAYIQAEHAQLEALLATLSEEQMLRAGVAGAWSVKDVLVHLTWWEQDLLAKLATGEVLDPELKGDPLAVDHANALIIEAKRKTPLAEVLAEFLSSYQQVLRAIEELSEEDLAREATYQYLVNNTGAHYAEHRVWITASLQPRRRFYVPALSIDEL